MKKLLLIVIVLISLSYRVDAQEVTSQDIMEEYSSIYSDDIEAAANESGIYEAIPEFDAEKLIKDTSSGKSLFDIKAILNRIWELLFGEIRSTIKIMLYIMTISILSSYLSALPDGRSKEVSHVAFYACYIIIAGICSAVFLEIMGCAQGAINNILIVARLVVPVVIAGLAATGAITSAAVFQPVLLGVIQVALTVIEKIFIPIIMLFTSLNIVSCISDNISAKKMLEFLGKTVKWGLSILLTVFVGTAGFQSLVSGGVDGLSIKLTKYATSNLIPVVGGILSESVETVMNCSVIIKNSVGITGIILIIGVMLMPIIKVSACLIILRITAAIIQPVSEDRIVRCVSGVADSVGLVFAILASVTVMFVIILTIMLGAGNSAVMLGR